MMSSLDAIQNQMWKKISRSSSKHVYLKTLHGGFSGWDPRNSPISCKLSLKWLLLHIWIPEEAHSPELHTSFFVGDSDYRASWEKYHCPEKHIYPQVTTHLLPSRIQLLRKTHMTSASHGWDRMVTIKVQTSTTISRSVKRLHLF